jgi:ABC-type molybdate transport system substrate-binding protein
MPAAAQIKVLSGGAMRGLLLEIIPLFERAGDARVTVEFGLTSELKKAIADGARFDIALLPRPEIDGLAHDGKIVTGTATDIARSARCGARGRGETQYCNHRRL